MTSEGTAGRRHRLTAPPLLRDTARAGRPGSVAQRVVGALPTVLQCGVASAAAWFVAESWLGHEQPVFAATSAVICLAAGTGGPGRQAVDLLAGVFAGLLVGQLARALPPEPGVDVLCAATLLRATGPGTRPAGAADDLTAAADGLGQPGNRSGELLRGVAGLLGGPDGPARCFRS